MMKEEFNRFIREHYLAGPSTKILMAVSGGIDSMVMADLFISSGYTTGIAHCNFNLRGDESDGDEEFVRQFAASKKITFFSERFDTSGYAEEKGISIQMAARELRYRWFEEVRIKNGFDFIALAHNLNDNVETFLINLTRGTGITGLTGMKPLHNKLIRPLLFASRNAIMEYSMIHKIKFREDKTNSEIKYTRNKIRHSIIPLFREINSSFDSTIAETAERFNEITDIVKAYINPIREKILVRKDNLIIIRTKDLPESSFRRTLLFELFRPFGIGSAQIEDLGRLSYGKTGSQMFTDQWRLIKNRNEIIVIPRESGSGSYYEISSPGEFKYVPWIISAGIRKITDEFEISSSRSVSTLDSDKISWPLIIRHHSPGDFFYPLGMRSRKKLSDYFIDRKYSRPEKESKLVLESAGRICWIIGDRIDNRFRITPSSRNALIIEVGNI